MKRFLVGLLIVTACGSPSDKKEPNEENEAQDQLEVILPENRLHFFRINNIVKVYMDDSLVYENSVLIDGSDVDEFLDLTPFLDGFENLKIELYNGEEPFDETQGDRYWEIRYDLFFDNEIADFAQESESTGDLGKVFEVNYKLEEWMP